MRVYIIKSKGAATWYNMFFDRTVTFSDQTKISIGILFFRKKEAMKYLNTLEYKEFYEVVGATIN
jgi:hypothetical protein